MSATLNVVTGEVTQTIAGKEYKFKASMSRMAEFQSRLAVPGLGVTMIMLRESDPRAIFFGLKCLCTSGNGSDFDELVLTSHMGDAKEALTMALTAGLPDQTDKPLKKAKAARKK